MINRELFQPEHETFRDTVRRFIDKEIAPHHAQWEKDGIVPRELWRKAGAADWQANLKEWKPGKTTTGGHR